MTVTQWSYQQNGVLIYRFVLEKIFKQLYVDIPRSTLSPRGVWKQCLFTLCCLLCRVVLRPWPIAHRMLGQCSLRKDSGLISTAILSSRQGLLKRIALAHGIIARLTSLNSLLKLVQLCTNSLAARGDSVQYNSLIASSQKLLITSYQWSQTKSVWFFG